MGGGTQRALRREVDIIVAAGATVIAAKQATEVVPIVFAVSADPLGTGVVPSLARPGGNVTGLSLQQTDLGAKRLELLRGCPLAGAVLEMEQVQAMAGRLGLEVVALKIRRADDIAPAFDALKGRAEALYVVGDPLVTSNRIRINTLALVARLPTMHIERRNTDGENADEAKRWEKNK